MNNKRITVIAIILVMIGIFLWGKYDDIMLEKRGVLINAKTNEWVIGAKMSLGLQYEFYYNGKKITSDNSFGSFSGNKHFENKYFPVIYNPKSGSSQLLIEPSDFERFNLSFPDSLKWVLHYINN